MTLNTVTAAFTITPVVCTTFLKHLKRKIKKKNIRDEDDTEAVDDILFEEAFHIVKAFLGLATRNTLDELQAFTNTYIPPPYWAECVPVTIPLPCCNKAADVLINWFGPEQLKEVVGGEKWWQVRGLEGVQAEWIAMKRDWDRLQKSEKAAKRSNRGKGKVNPQFSDRLDNMNKVIYYIHGGILRMARKLGGRAFAVNYRKAPQYPCKVFAEAACIIASLQQTDTLESGPCPLQDVLAAYLYLIHPPPGAPHTAIDPKRLIIAGDSAGGNLALSLLVLLRDMGLPAPAGAVLISPWVDLTHSFPSITQNINTPSTLWPIPTTGPHVVPVSSADPKKMEMGREPTAIKSADKEKPEEHPDGDPPRQGQSDSRQATSGSEDSPDATLHSRTQSSTGPPTIPSFQPSETPTANVTPSPSSGRQRATSDQTPLAHSDSEAKNAQDVPISKLDDKVLESQKVQVDMDGQIFEIRSQFQICATNAQVTHPLVSPLLNSSLGGLPPLYILAGSYEVLRDEIVYLAHRAADPARFPLRPGLINTTRQKENVEKFKQATQVHFQLYDDMCHVLTVFSFTTSANFAYRGIARFAKRVMEHPEAEVGSDPFPATKTGDNFSPLATAALPVSGVPSGVDSKQSPSVTRGDHVGRERTGTDEIKSADDTRLEENPEVRDKAEDGKRPVVDEAARKSHDNTLKEKDDDDDGFYPDLYRRYTPFDLSEEDVPPPAIAGRKDTHDALALIEASFRKPVPLARPKKEKPDLLSPAEQQRVSNKIPTSHGVRLWSSLMSKFMNTNLKRQASRSEPSELLHDRSPDSASINTATPPPGQPA
ncbi:hypothetical protein M407DRAFT_3841 [Tulasnella calospora MUT 4182]|uniref:Alpha/beta hydrolase fold-3 domain-containing protein n=1 Tax=Tulasnella calospora MUT 4182 TaxID=1051891 RepID=A0A0C3QVX7_9AGAM|nr:hypothetical protein M407DRAFT_3841 [Tulasnella calospora MUT 4182]